METTYLPGTVQDRIADLMKQHKITQEELAVKLGITKGTLSRFLSGKTDKLSDENIIRIARIFNVSTDFLLGVTNVPDRKNYEITELGLSAQATRNLYTGKVNTAVVNRLLEHPGFADLTYLIDQYLSDTLAAGFAAQNTMFATLSDLISGTNKQAAADINRLQAPIYQAELANIETRFMAVIQELKADLEHDLSAQTKLTKQITENMFRELTKGQDMRKAHITPEQVSAAVIGQVAGMDGVDSEKLNHFGDELTNFLRSAMESDNEYPH